MQQHVLVVVVVVAEGHLQHVALPRAPTGAVHPRPSAVEGHAVVQLTQPLLLDTHAMEEAPAVGHGGPLVLGGRVALLLQDHLLRQLAHDGLGGQPREAGDGRQVAEHQHARRKVGVHATVAQKLVA